MKGFGNAKFIFLQPPCKQVHANGNSQFLLSLFVSHPRFCLIAFLSFFTLASFLALFSSAGSRDDAAGAGVRLRYYLSASPSSVASPLHPAVFDTLVDYAVNSNSSGKMAEADLRAVARVLRRRAPCNFLVFGISNETPLWRALNHGGRTVFVDENEYYVAHVEGRNPPGLEAYDVSYTTKVRELPELLLSAQKLRGGDCRPVQNLLFSDCRLAINDLPNQLYDVAWDVILVDGPQGYSASSPGRMSAIFTAAVMARSVGKAPIDVLVHDYERKVERVCSEEFLCRENLVASTGHLAHFVIRKGGAAASRDEFCSNWTTDELAGSTASEAKGVVGL